MFNRCFKVFFKMIFVKGFLVLYKRNKIYVKQGKLINERYLKYFLLIVVNYILKCFIKLLLFIYEDRVKNVNKIFMIKVK